MKVLMINSVCGIRSTGRICTDLALELKKQGHEVKIAYGREKVPDPFKDLAIRIGNKFDNYISALKARVSDNEGFNCTKATEKFLSWAEQYNPDILWLHNLHGYYINVELLFAWIKNRPDMQVKWTLHDCWAFTGHCAHFSAVGCERWKVYCTNCPQSRIYPVAYRDNCKNNYNRKKAAFSGVTKMTLITPSQWLADLVQESFLKMYPVEVIYNTIDTNVFKPVPSDFRERFQLNDKKIILGVASVWNERKGLQDFYTLSGMLSDKYTIVLVGLTKKQLRNLPQNIIGITRTNNVKELAEIYTVADVFVNLTYEDTFPTVNIEALSCGTPVITYRTGGSPECLDAECGSVVECGDIRTIKKKIELVCSEKPYSVAACLNRAVLFDKNRKGEEK